MTLTRIALGAIAAAVLVFAGMSVTSAGNPFQSIQRGDINCDDTITPEDATALLRFDAGLDTGVPEGCAPADQYLRLPLPPQEPDDATCWVAVATYEFVTHALISDTPCSELESYGWRCEIADTEFGAPDCRSDFSPDALSETCAEQSADTMYCTGGNGMPNYTCVLREGSDRYSVACTADSSASPSWNCDVPLEDAGAQYAHCSYRGGGVMSMLCYVNWIAGRADATELECWWNPI